MWIQYRQRQRSNDIWIWSSQHWRRNGLFTQQKTDGYIIASEYYYYVSYSRIVDAFWRPVIWFQSSPLPFLFPIAIRPALHHIYATYTHTRVSSIGRVYRAFPIWRKFVIAIQSFSIQIYYMYIARLSSSPPTPSLSACLLILGSNGWRKHSSTNRACMTVGSFCMQTDEIPFFFAFSLDAFVFQM